MNENTKHQLLVGAFSVAIGSLFYAMGVCT